jgi:hypothetical protein
VPGQDEAPAGAKYPLDLLQASSQVRPHDYGVGGDHGVAGRVRRGWPARVRWTLGASAVRAANYCAVLAWRSEPDKHGRRYAWS